MTRGRHSTDGHNSGARLRPVSFRPRDTGPTLRGNLHLPEEGSGSFPAAVVCHPHTMMGGHQDNAVVVGVCRALAAAGWAALRFDFRGAGRSEGRFQGGEGEMDDVQGAVDLLCREPKIDPERLVVVGYSFGAGVALHHAVRDPRLQAMAGIALVEQHYDDPFLHDDLRPKLFVVGDDDPWAPTEALRTYVESLKPPKKLHIISGAGHLFTGHIADAAGAVVEWLNE